MMRRTAVYCYREDRAMRSSIFVSCRVPYINTCSCSMPPLPHHHHHHHLASGRIVASVSVAVTSETTIKTSRREQSESESLAQKQIDAWMRVSTMEIVTSMKDAPLLIHVYGGDEKMTTETKKRAERGNWAELTTAPLPEGVIFVKELTDENDDVGDGVTSVVRNEATKIWGLVVHGRGCGPVCYLLKTCRVEDGSGCGSGVAYIHFLLLRVTNFREKASSQLRNCWSAQSPQV